MTEEARADSATTRTLTRVLPVSRDLLVLATLTREASATVATAADSAMRRVPAVPEVMLPAASLPVLATLSREESASVVMAADSAIPSKRDAAEDWNDWLVAA